jgi:hypothetical protein
LLGTSVVVAIAIVLLTSCGGDDGDEAETPTTADQTTTTASPEMTTTSAPTVDDAAQTMGVVARAACLRFATDGTDDATADEVVATLVDAGAFDFANRTLFIMAFASECPEYLVALGGAQSRAGLS